MEPTAGWFEGREHVLPVRIYYEDTDFSGVVYHGGYVRFFERGRTDFLRLAGVHHRALFDRADPLAFGVTRLSIDFRRAARMDDALEVRTRFAAAKGPRLLIRQSILRAAAEPIAEAEVEVVCIDGAGRARRPPADLLAALAPYFDSSEA
jgi:acyl-CoA thioester hydrolase